MPDQPSIKRCAIYSGSSVEKDKRGLIDVVVVHRLDRLTRNLSDFQRIIAEFNAHNVVLVSVTQQLDMSHHVGRLATNILTFFAEFEREMVGQRVKEKRAATLQNGRWQGTSCSLGYRIKNDCLVIDAAESAIVQELFFRYANHESGTVLIRDLDERGIRTKQWLTRTGKPRGGQPFNRNAIYLLLKNRVYLGEVFFGGDWQRGAHEPIIEDALWAQVQGLLENRSRRCDTRADTENDTIFMLKGRVFGADGRAMSPWLSSSYKARKYAYYIPQREIAEGAGASGLTRLQAANLNDQVWTYLRRTLADQPGCWNICQRN